MRGRRILLGARRDLALVVLDAVGRVTSHAHSRGAGTSLTS